MASSLGSFPFLIDTNVDTSLLLQAKINRPLRFPLFVYRPAKYAEITNLNASAFEHSESTGLNFGRLVSRRSRGLLWRSKNLRAIGKSAGTSEDDDGAEDVLQNTIEKSKKVLAMQRDLLQRVLFYLRCRICFMNVEISILREAERFSPSSRLIGGLLKHRKIKLINNEHIILGKVTNR